MLTGMTGISLRMQWPLTYQLHGSVSQRERLVFSLRIKLRAQTGFLKTGSAPQSAETVFLTDAEVVSTFSRQNFFRPNFFPPKFQESTHPDLYIKFLKDSAGTKKKSKSEEGVADRTCPDCHKVETIF
jgi:hypothetical protein